MLQIIRNKDEITVREILAAHWIYSVLIGAVLFFVVLLGLFDFALSIAAFISIAGFPLYYRDAPAATTKINRTDKTIPVRTQNFLRYDFKVYSFNDAADQIYIDKTKLIRGAPLFQIILPLN